MHIVIIQLNRLSNDFRRIEWGEGSLFELGRADNRYDERNVQHVQSTAGFFDTELNFISHKL